MENRGQKRAEIVDELPADKRACSSLESKPSTSNSSVRTHMNSANTVTPKVHEGDMETSPSTSASGRSDGEGDKDSAYGSCDSDEMDDDKERNSLREFQEQRAFSDHGKFRRVILSLNDEVEPSSQLVALTELCELLSFSTQNSLSSTTVDSLSPTLVKLVKHETSPDIMLYAVRAITYLCDVYPRSSSFLVRYEAIPALCEKLLVIEYLDVAEQCLQALEKISRDQPLVCLQAGAVMAVLNYIDFFSTSVKKVALSTVANICKRIPSECPPLFMEAVPILSNLLQYEDRQLVESAANCFINVVERVNQSPEVLDGLCNYGLIQQAAHLVNMNSQITLSQPIYTGLLGLLVKLASGSITAVRTLFELKISSILKDILSSYDVSFGMPSPHVVDGRHNQVCEVLKLLNGLLPLLSTDQDVQLPSLKKSFLEDRPDLLLKFGMDIMPMLVQVVNAGANIHICYGCLSVINKLVYFSKPDMLYKLLEGTNISSFLAGVFTRKDGHVLNLALQIAEALLQKLSDKYLNSFIKEGVLFAVDALLMPEKCLQSRLSAISGVKVSFDSGHKSGVKDLRNCLCYAFDTGPHLSASTIDSCKLEKESFYNLAKHIRTSYFASESGDIENGWTDIFQKLRTLSSALTDVVNLSMNNASGHHDEEFYNILHQIMVMLVGEEPISTFEFIESGIVKSLINYLSNGLYLREKLELHAVHNNIQIIEKRYWLFFRVFLSMPQASKDLPLLSLIHRLQNALSLVENFPVTMNHSYKQRNSYATIPNGCRIAHPCVKVRFLRGEGETCLCDYYSEDVLTVDPLSSFDAIETFLRPKVITRHKNSANRAIGQANLRPSQFPADVHSPQGKVPDHMEVDTSISTEMQEDQEILSHVPPEGASIIKQAIAGETPSPEETSGAFAEEAMQGSLETDSSMDTEDSASCSSENASPKLLFYLEGKLVDSTLTLYQAILQQQAKDVDEFISNAKLWSQVYKVTYRKTEESIQNQPQQCPQESQNLRVSEKIEKCWPFAAFNPSLFVSELVSNLEKASPTYDVLFLLRNLEGMNRLLLQLMYRERLNAFAEGKVENLDSLRVGAPGVSQNEFVNSKLTEKIEQQMRDPLSISVGGMPLWCNQLMTSSPFLFGFEAKCKFFRLAAFGSLIVRPNQSSQINSGSPNDRPPNAGSLSRKKFSVCRDRILDSAAQMMDLHAHEKAILEVVYSEEVGTGLGPTLEFYTLVSDEFQKTGMGMWREDHCSSISWNSSQAEDSRVVTPFGLFPRPRSSTVTTSTGVQFSEVIKKFILLGQVVAKALQDGRVMDLPFSKAFYKLILGQELSLYDIQSFDPELYRTLLEFQALVDRKSFLESDFQDNKIHKIDLCFHNTRIEDLSLEFVLPGYPDYILTSGAEYGMVDMDSLREYVSLIVDATVNAGISRQVEAFRSGFNQVFPIKHLQIFTEEELERLLCGECDSWAFNELLDHIKFDHGYTASSPPIVNLLEIMQEFGTEQRRAFLQFVTGAPRLPPGGLSSLSPKLTVVRKHCSKWADADLPSVMTCANYLKLPAYSSKDMMKERLLYAITEGQGAFHLS